MRGIMAWWHRRQRAVDIEMLWPELKEEAGGNLTAARHAMYLHASIDSAWQAISFAERTRIIEGLE